MLKFFEYSPSFSLVIVKCVEALIQAKDGVAIATDAVDFGTLDVLAPSQSMTKSESKLRERKSHDSPSPHADDLDSEDTDFDDFDHEHEDEDEDEEYADEHTLAEIGDLLTRKLIALVACCTANASRDSTSLNTGTCVLRDGFHRC